MTAHSFTFDTATRAKVGHYVYRLVDPRNGETFYVGKGSGDRVFAHANGTVDAAEELPEKIARIREIKLEGLSVIHVIHRHGMTDEAAYEVEAALIDAYPGLANEVGGRYSGDRGPMSTSQIIKLYGAETARFQHKALLINVNRSATKDELYDATRFAWRLNPSKAAQAELILAVRSGLIVGAFIADRWLESTPENFPGFPASTGRWGFVGYEAPKELASLYLQKRIPAELRKRGASNPIRYTWEPEEWTS